jgi:hypothetical protein
MPTKTDVRRLLKKGLTGKEAARLILQDSWKVDNDEEGFLSESDIQAIKSSLKTAQDIEDYTKWVEVYRLIDYSVRDAERAYLWIRVRIDETVPAVMSFYTAEQVRRLRHAVPQIVTARQYEDIKAAERQERMEQILSLWDVVDWLDVTQILPEETIQAWERYEFEDESEDEDAFYEYVLDWLYYKKKDAKSAALYIEYLIELIRGGNLQPVMLSAAEQEEADKAETLRPIYERKRAKSSKRTTAKLIRQLERLRDGLMSVEEGKQLLQYTYCSGQEVYEAGIAQYIEYVDVGHDDPAYSYAILQEERSLFVDSRGYYDPRHQDLILSQLSDLDIFQGAFSRLDSGEPGSGLVTALMVRYGEIRVLLKGFLAVYSIIEACSEITGIPFIEKLQDWYRGIQALVGEYNFSLERANLSGHYEYYEGPEIKLPLLDIERLKPDPEQLQYMRERMAIALGPDWFRDTTLKLLEESSVLTEEEINEIRDEQERKGQYSPFRGVREKLEAADEQG